MKYFISVLLLIFCTIIYSQELEIDSSFDDFQIISVEEQKGIFMVYKDISLSYPYFFINEYSEDLSLLHENRYDFPELQSIDVVDAIKIPDENIWYLFANKYKTEDDYSMHMLKIVEGSLVKDTMLLPSHISGDVQTYYDHEDHHIYAFGNIADSRLFFVATDFFIMSIDIEKDIMIKRDYSGLDRIRGISEHPSDPNILVTFSLRYMNLFQKVTLDSISQNHIYEGIELIGNSSDGDYYEVLEDKLWSINNIRLVPEIPEPDDRYRVFLYSFDGTLKVDSFQNLDYYGIGATKKAFDFKDDILYISLVSVLSPFTNQDYLTNQRIMAIKDGEVIWHRDYITQTGFRYVPQGIKKISTGNILVYGSKNASTNFEKDNNYPFMLLLSEDGDFITSTEDPSTFIELKLYPNPVVDRFHLSLGNVTNEIQGDIINSIGEIVKSELILRQGDNEIYVPELPSGSYYIRLKSKEGMIGTTQFIKM